LFAPRLRAMSLAALVVFLLAFALPATAEQDFRIIPVSESVYVAFAQPGSQEATSNIMVIETKESIFLAGAHFAPAALEELTTFMESLLFKPVRGYILTHHHKGFSYVDFDFPKDKTVYMSVATWKVLDEEVREIGYSVTAYNEGVTIKDGGTTIILTNMGPGHTEGDTMLFLPEEKILFASDLVYFDSVGYMGEGFMHDWMLSLEFIDELQPEIIIPGFGPQGTVHDLRRYKEFFRAFMTEVLGHLEKGDSLRTTQKNFRLPKYADLPGYDQFLEANIERVYLDLQRTLSP